MHFCRKKMMIPSPIRLYSFPGLYMLHEMLEFFGRCFSTLLQQENDDPQPYLSVQFSGALHVGGKTPQSELCLD